MNNKVSLCMIVKDEEKYLSQCLNSIKEIVDEIIIVDTGSKDKTIEIAESFGAKIYRFPWTNNFSEARNESLKYATKEWILIMDADDQFCIEDKEKFKKLIDSNLDANSVYFFETLNYCGSFVDNNSISVNLNPRLFKNNHGFNYDGQVHNQLLNSKFAANDITCDIRIYHYGYLDENIKSKDKRNRNITLLQDQLSKNPNYDYANFNLGNEYYALGDMKKALEYYNKAYKFSKPYAGYSYILFVRMVAANYYIGEYDKALEYAEIGLKYYPPLTDLCFFKALVYKALKKPTLAIKALEKCVEMGEPPSELKFLYGTGSFKSLYELANIYMDLRDYETAYDYYIKTINSKRDFVIPVYNIAHLLKKDKMPLEEIEKLLKRFFTNYPSANLVLADIFYNEGYYETALEYIEKCDKSPGNLDNINILKAKTFMRTGNFKACIEIDFIPKESSFYFKLQMYKALSALITDKKEYAQAIVESFKDSPLSDNNKKVLQVYTQFIKLFSEDTTEVLSEDEKEKEYTAVILEICEILLVNKKFDEFEKALNLFNLISDNLVLLLLGKLYYKYGYEDMARKEIIRSIKQFEVFDDEGLDILYSNR